MSQEAVEGILDVNDPVGSLLQVVLRYEATPEQGPQAGRSPWRRVRYFFQEPSAHGRVRAARSGQPADRPAAGGRRRDDRDAGEGGGERPGVRLLRRAEQWYLVGGIHPIAQYVEEGMRPLRSIWPKPNEPDS
jgi:hypothetical protein